jgi:hypothetical protein
MAFYLFNIISNLYTCGHIKIAVKKQNFLGIFLEDFNFIFSINSNRLVVKTFHKIAKNAKVKHINCLDGVHT